MVRAPCCEKMGLKKGPWTAEEDQILISYIQNHGHGNWRALPKLAGLLRCGKSCRLRWTNYLRPDIKRGNFTREEEDAIINLHQMLGNRWSAIAAKLPGRTDNEIKNVWHTHLKKRLTRTDKETGQERIRKTQIEPKEEMPTQSYSSTPEPSSSSSTVENSQNSMESFSHEAEAQGIDESFWTEVLKMDSNDEYYYNSSDSMAMEGINSSDFSDDKFWLSAGVREEDDDLSFWLRIFLQAEEFPQI